VLQGAPERGRRERLLEPRLAAPRQECRALRPQGIAGEKNHPRAEVGILLLQQGVELRPTEGWQPEITQEDVIGLGLEGGHGTLASIRQIHGGAVPAQQCGQDVCKGRIVLNQ
jgi:hypothetical protein